MRRPHTHHLQARHRSASPREHRARARPRLPRLCHSDGARGRRNCNRPQAKRDLHLLRGHDAGARGRGKPSRRQGRGRRRSLRLFAARRSEDRAREPGQRGGVLRHRLRDHGPLDRADAHARQGRGHRELLGHVQPRDDRAAPQGAPRLSRPEAGPRSSDPVTSRPSLVAVPTSSSPPTTGSRSSSPDSSRSISCSPYT